MKKTSKPTSKKSGAKKPAAKKSATKPTRKAQGGLELAQVVDRLDAIMEKLEELLERVAELSRPLQETLQESATRAELPPDFTATPIEPEEDGEPENSAGEQ